MGYIEPPLLTLATLFVLPEVVNYCYLLEGPKPIGQDRHMHIFNEHGQPLFQYLLEYLCRFGV